MPALHDIGLVRSQIDEGPIGWAAAADFWPDLRDLLNIIRVVEHFGDCDPTAHVNEFSNLC